MKTIGIIALALLSVGFTYKTGSKVTWDAVTTDINGNPENVVSAELGLFIPGNTVPLNSLLGINPNPGDAGQSIDMLVQGQPEGIYQVRVRVQDAAGNWSQWGPETAESELILDRTPPATPGGCRIFK